MGRAAVVGGALLGVGSAAGLMGKAISAAADMETLETAFIPLLGSAAAAEARLRELSEFAASTPFELPEIATASKVLETLTRGALSTGEGLRLVGDLASGTNQPFGDLAVTVGRLYDGLDSGRPVGEALARLQELGAISGDVRGRIEQLQKEGARGPEVWAVAAEAIGRFSGSMELQSQTWNGMLSTLKDNVGLAFAEFGKPIIDAVRPFLDRAIGSTQTLGEAAAKFGQRVGQAITFFATAWSSGELGGIIGGAMKLGMMEGVNVLWAGMRASIAAFGQYLVESVRNGILYFQILMRPDFWSGMGDVMAGTFLGAVAFLQRGLGEAMALVRPLAELFGKGDAITKAQAAMAESAGILEEEAAGFFADAGDRLGPIMAELDARFKEAGANIGKRFMDTFRETADVFDTTAVRNGMAEGIGRVKSLMDENAAKAAKSVEEGGEKLKEATVKTAEAVERAAKFPVFAGGGGGGGGGEEPVRRRGLLNAEESAIARAKRRSAADQGDDVLGSATDRGALRNFYGRRSGMGQLGGGIMDAERLRNLMPEIGAKGNAAMAGARPAAAGPDGGRVVASAVSEGNHLLASIDRRLAALEGA
jgi:hypothetical protein